MAKAKPKCVGFWVIDVTNEELIKYGEEGDTEWPYETEEEARDQVSFLQDEADEHHKIYILKVFDNGQILTIETVE